MFFSFSHCDVEIMYWLVVVITIFRPNMTYRQQCNMLSCVAKHTTFSQKALRTFVLKINMTSNFKGQETAIEYGRAEGCLVDHRRYFSPTRCLGELKTLASRPHTPGVIEVPGLPLFNLPAVDGLFDDENVQVNSHTDTWLTTPATPLASSQHIPMLRELQTHIEAPDLGSCAAVDMEQHSQEDSLKSACDFSMYWIPLAPVNEDHDEGMKFPPQTERLHKQLLMELERQKPVPSNLKKFQVYSYRLPAQDKSSQGLKKV